MVRHVSTFFGPVAGKTKADNVRVDRLTLALLLYVFTAGDLQTYVTNRARQ